MVERGGGGVGGKEAFGKVSLVRLGLADKDELSIWERILIKAVKSAGVFNVGDHH